MKKFYNLERVLSIDKLTELELTVLNYILNNIEMMKKIGVKGVASKNFTSTTTVMRVAKKLGYSGFLEMIYDLEKKIKITQNEDRELFNFNSIIKVNSLERLGELAELIDNSVIYIYSEGFCEIITQYMYKKFLVLRKNPVLLHGLEIPIVYKQEKNSLLFIISRSGETDTCLRKVNHAKEIGGIVVGFTSNVDSTLFKNSDIAFCIEDNNRMDIQNYHSTYFYGNCINLFEKLIEITSRKDNILPN